VNRSAAPTPRAMWERTERLHGCVYTAPEPRETAAAAGLKGFWMAYFATRAAPMGAVGPEVVEATFFYYAPARIHRAIPDAWRLSSPQAVIDARYAAADPMLTRLLGPAATGAEVERAAALLRDAVDGCPRTGRALFAGWAGLPWPEPPHVALWHACTLLREFRSGAHLTALVAAGLDGCEAVVSHVAVDGAPLDWIEGEAKWTAEEAAGAVDRLRRRGWLDERGRITDAGRAGRQEVERMTNRLDEAPWRRLGPDRTEEVARLLDGLLPMLPPDDQLDWTEVYGTNPEPEG
jgi:hypothetical protein